MSHIICRKVLIIILILSSFFMSFTQDNEVFVYQETIFNMTTGIRGLAYSDAGFWVSDYGKNRIKYYDYSGQILKQYYFDRAHGITIDKDGYIWISRYYYNENRIRKIDPVNGTEIETYNAINEHGKATFLLALGDFLYIATYDGATSMIHKYTLNGFQYTGISWNIGDANVGMTEIDGLIACMGYYNGELKYYDTNGNFVKSEKLGENGTAFQGGISYDASTERLYVVDYATPSPLSVYAKGEYQGGEPVIPSIIDDLVYLNELDHPDIYGGYVISPTTQNNKIYLFGGWNNGSLSNIIRCYNTSLNQWESVNTTMPYPYIANETHNSAIASNGKIYIGPGNNNGGWGQNHRVIEFNPIEGTCIEKASITGGSKIWGIAFAPAPSNIGGVYLFGGWNGSGVNTIYHYDPQTDSVRYVGSLNAGRTIGTISYDNENVYLFGGNRHSTVVEVFNYATETITQVSNPQGFGFNHGSDSWTGVDGNIYIWNPDLAELGPGSESIVRFNKSDWSLENVGGHPYPYGGFGGVVMSYDKNTVYFFTRILLGYVWGVSGESVPEVWKLTLQETNISPIANAGLDQTIHSGDTVILDASNSSDPDENYPLTYEWNILSKPSGSTAELIDSLSVSPSFIADLPGDYEVQLIVTDDNGLSSEPDTVLISTYNAAPFADAGEDQSIIQLGSLIQLDGSQSYDEEGDSITYLWSVVDVPLGSSAYLSDSTSPNPTFIADVQGSYIFELVVSDSWSSSEPSQIVVSFENIQPVADAGNNQSTLQETTVILDGSLSLDANLDSLTYSWSIVSAPVDSTATISNPLVETTTFTPNIPGEYILSLIINDGFINSEPSNITIMVISYQDSLSDVLQRLLVAINALDDSDFKSKNMKKPLTNKVNVVIKKVTQNNYEDALSKLTNDILKKTDGCNDEGSPDKNDFITKCDAQSQVYPLIIEAIELLENLI